MWIANKIKIIAMPKERYYKNYTEKGGIIFISNIILDNCHMPTMVLRSLNRDLHASSVFFYPEHTLD